MSASIESLAVYERDMRSANKEWKRGKDAAAKWSRGARPLVGCRLDFRTDEITGGADDAHRAKVRPERKARDYDPKYEGNVNKLNRYMGYHPTGQIRSKINARQEIAAEGRSIADLVSTPTLARSMSASDHYLYSFDRVESPNRPLPLDVFVKPENARDTERLVRKEYEVLDANGLPLKGRKARRNLRSVSPEPDADEEDGFQLV